MKKPEFMEGPEAFERFRQAVKAVLSVPKSALPPKPHRKRKEAPLAEFTTMSDAVLSVSRKLRRKRTR